MEDNKTKRDCETCKHYVVVENRHDRETTKSCECWECNYERGMTESEAIKALRLEGGIEISGKSTRVAEFVQAMNMAISALEEAERYKNIGVVSADELEQDLLLYKADREILSEYQALGTVEELRIAKEKQIAKKPIDVILRINGKTAKCPICKCSVLRMPYCERCGQKLDWSDEE